MSIAHLPRPQSEARRKHIYGPTLPMRPEGESGFWTGTLATLLGSGLIVSTVLIAKELLI